MQNIKQSAITQTQIDQFVSENSSNVDLWAYVFWFKSMQDDLLKIPSIYDLTDCKLVSGNATFPPLPPEKLGLLFLSSGTYEATVIGGADKWRRLYDGTTFDPATNIP